MKFLDVPQSGSIAGTVHSHNRAGQYTRNRRSPVQPIGTGRRAFIRAAFGGASSGWSGLTDDQRAAWAGFAALYPVTDSLGQSITLTGHQMYVRCNVGLANAGQSPTATPPADNTVPLVAGSNITAGIVAGISIDGFAGAGEDYVFTALSQQVSPGRNFWKTFWQPAGTNGWTNGDLAPYALTTAIYAAQFGTPVLGKKLFARVTPMNAGGFNGAPTILSTVWVA